MTYVAQSLDTQLRIFGSQKEDKGPTLHIGQYLSQGANGPALVGGADDVFKSFP